MSYITAGKVFRMNCLNSSSGREVGVKYEYSNLAMGLLGHALTRKAGALDYQALVVARICKPLGMLDTTITLSEEQNSRLARGHLSNGMATLNWDLPTLTGAGAIRSSVHDMLKFVAACIEQKNEAFAEALVRCLGTRRELSSRSWVALGWHVSGAGAEEMVWHNGATGGYCSFVGFRPATRTGVVVLCNRQKGKGPTPAALGNEIVSWAETR